MKTSHVSAALFFAVISANAESISKASENSSWNCSFTQLVMTQYYGTWVGGIFRHDPYSFTTVAAARMTPYGLFHVSGSIGQTLDHIQWNTASSQELDAETGIQGGVGEGWSRLETAYTLSYIGATPLGMLRDDVLSSVVQIKLPNAPACKPYVTIIRSDTFGRAPGSGWFVFGGFTSSVRLTKTTYLSLDYRTGYSGGIYGAGKGWDYHRLEISIPLITKSGWSIVPAVAGQTSAHGQPAGHAFVTNSRLFATCSFTHRL